MGTGASKKATADAEKASFDDDDTDEDFDTYSKKKVAALNEITISLSTIASILYYTGCMNLFRNA